MSHTPAPWRYVPPQKEYHKPVVQRGTEGGFAVHGLTKSREEADARLIAAAPDLLSALVECVSKMHQHGIDPYWTEEARAAIAKAGGA